MGKVRLISASDEKGTRPMHYLDLLGPLSSIQKERLIDEPGLIHSSKFHRSPVSALDGCRSTCDVISPFTSAVLAAMAAGQLAKSTRWPASMRARATLAARSCPRAVIDEQACSPSPADHAENIVFTTSAICAS